VIDDCQMTEDCPGYDRDRRVCLLRPADCEFARADRDPAVMVETPEAQPLEASALGKVHAR
jgi:hypothetical protein